MSAQLHGSDVLSIIDRASLYVRESKDAMRHDDLLDLESARAAVAGMVEQRNDLIAALEAVMRIDMRGHQLQDRLQFSDVGRAILHQATSALARAKGSDRAALGRDEGSKNAAIDLLIKGVSDLLASESPHMTHRNAKEREAYKTIRASLTSLGVAA